MPEYIVMFIVSNSITLYACEVILEKSYMQQNDKLRNKTLFSECMLGLIFMIMDM
jgi:hypothetical protein